MIIANHAHIYPKELREDGTVDCLKKLMDDCGIDKCVAFATFPDKFTDAGRTDSPNRWLADAIKGDPDLYGFGTVDFTKDNLKEQVEEIAELGFKGIKLHPPYQEFDIDGEKAFQVYEKAEELGLFISFHCGIHWYRLKGVRPILYDEVAWNFPNLKFSLEHIGGYHFFAESLAVMCNNDNVYGGWTSVSDEKGSTAWTLTNEQLETVVRQVHEGKNIFGLDFPFHKADYIKYEINRYNSLDISDTEKANILGNTLAGILGIRTE